MRVFLPIALVLGIFVGFAGTGPARPAIANSGGAAIGSDPRALWIALNELRVDGTCVFTVRDFHFKRSALDITLSEGKLAFLLPLEGHVLGAVFTGNGNIVALPPNPAERRSIAEFLGVPILDEPFSRAYFRFTDDSAEMLEGRLKAAKVAAGEDEPFAENWNAQIGNLNSSHAVRTMFDLLSTDPLAYFSGAMAGSRVGPFDALVDPRLAQPVLLGQPHSGPGGERYNVWATFAPADTPAAAETVQPVDYRIETTIADDLSLSGDAHLRLKAEREGERMIALELSRALSVESVTPEGGAPLVFFQNEDLSRQEIASRGNDELYVVLPSGTRAQEEIRLEIKYRGSVISDTGNGVYFVGARGSWYPHTRRSGEFARFDLTFRWPRRLTLVATGRKIEEHEDGGQRVGRWTPTTPISVAGFNLGEYEEESVGTGKPTIELYANHQLEDWLLARIRARLAADAQQMAQGTEREFTRDPFGDVMVIAAGGPPSPAALLKHLGAEFSDCIRFFEGINGPFPFDELDIAPIPGEFGQGWPGLVYLTTLAYLPPQMQEEAGLNRHAQEQIEELLPFHEVAHQWWGNESATSSFRDAWLDEAVANYEALMYADSKKPSGHILTTWLNRYKADLLAVPSGGQESVDDAGPLSLGRRLDSSKTPRAYETITYGKGTWVIHMLREMLREPSAKMPDAKFEQALRSVLEDHRYQPMTTEDFQRGIEKRMTRAMDLEGNHRLDWFFEEWVRDTGIPRYSVEVQVKPRGQEFLITGKLKQDRVPDYFTEAVPLYATHSGAKPSYLGTVTTAGPQTAFHFVAAARPGKIIIDPQNTILCKSD